MGGAVWSYFQTFYTRQSTYAPVVMIGSGLSIMYVMALVFITELIGENKVSLLKQASMVSRREQNLLSSVTVHFQPAIFETEMT